MSDIDAGSMKINPLAGTPATAAQLINVAQLITAYFNETPDPNVALQRVQFGTSGHRGSPLERTFNEAHVLAITQAICHYRKLQHIDGPIFVGIDTHAVSEPAFASALEVLAANSVTVMMAPRGEYTPTPSVSRAILTYNQTRTTGFSDGIVISPSHNPPENGGFKYNPVNGGPADTQVTGWIEDEANKLLVAGLRDVKRLSYEQALHASTTHHYDFLNAYVEALDRVIDMATIRGSGLHLGVDPLGGAGVHYWDAIASRYQLNLSVTNPAVDPTFRFMTLDWDGQIRMDPSSPYAMESLVKLKDSFDIAFACDTDHDRHGIVTPSTGLLPANHYLAVMVDYLFQHRPQWRHNAAVGKTVVSTQMIDRVAARLGRDLYEVPVGFKWFASGLLDGSLGFGGEESAGAGFLSRDGSAWTTDKDGIAAALLSAEITASTGQDPGKYYNKLVDALGEPSAGRIQAAATPAQRALMLQLSEDKVTSRTLAGEPVLAVLTRAPGNNAPIGGLKVVSEHGWFAARPSGTEDIYKIYAESFCGEPALRSILDEAQTIVNLALKTGSSP